MRLSSEAENPWLYAGRTGDNQNFAAFRHERYAHAPARSDQSQRRRTGRGPLLRTVGLTTSLSQLLRMSHGQGWDVVGVERSG